MLDHLVDHFFNHSKVLHDVIMSNPLCCRDFFKFSWSLIIYHFKDLFNCFFNSINLRNCQFIFFNILFIFFFILFNLLLKFFLFLFLLSITSKTLIFIFFNFSSKNCNLFIEHFRFFLQLINKSIKREISFFSFDKVFN